MFISSFISSSPKLKRTQSPSTGRTADARNGDELQKHCRQGTIIVIQSRSVVAYGQGWGWGLGNRSTAKGQREPLFTRGDRILCILSHNCIQLSKLIKLGHSSKLIRNGWILVSVNNSIKKNLSSPFHSLSESLKSPTYSPYSHLTTATLTFLLSLIQTLKAGAICETFSETR